MITPTPGQKAPVVICELCGNPMPLGEEMFRYHGHSGPCPKPSMRLHFTNDWLQSRIDAEGYEEPDVFTPHDQSEAGKS